MFEYLDKIFDNIKQIPELEGKIKAFSLDNVFSQEHYDKLSNDTIKYKEYTKKDAPPEGEEPSVITFEEIEKKDIFYFKLWEYFRTDEIKLKLLKKFGYNGDVQNTNRLLKCMHQTISFHTEYPHQIDNSHTDQKFTLQTFTIQIYLPKDNSIKDYGTDFIDHNEEVLIHKQFLPNTGYIMASNNNSWHKPTMGVERKSLIIRYHIELDYEKVRRVFNYNKNNSTCYIVWNKNMGVHEKITDWMTNMTFANLIEHNFENVAATREPFINDLQLLVRLKKQGYRKAVIFFGGYIWKTDEFKKYADELDMKEIIIGMKFDDEFARQCFILNLDRLDELVEADARDGFFSKYMNNDSKDISELIWTNRKYYHPEVNENADVNTFIRLDTTVDKLKKEQIELYDKLKYMLPYRKNYTDLSSMTYSIDNKSVLDCLGDCKEETIHLDVNSGDVINLNYDVILNNDDKFKNNTVLNITKQRYICTKCFDLRTAYEERYLKATDYDESLYPTEVKDKQ